VLVDRDAGLQRSQAEDPLRSGARNVRDDRSGPGRDQQFVEEVRALPAVFEIPDAERALRDIDGENVVTDADVDVPPAAKLVGRSHHEPPFAVNEAADVVGHAAGGIGTIAASFVHHDIGVGPSLADLPGGGHSRGVAADDDAPLLFHDDPSPVVLFRIV
jgi:hypothetical protein